MRGTDSLSLDRRQLLQGGALLGAASLLPSGAALGARAQAPGLVPVPIPEQAPAQEGMAKLPDVNLWYWDTGGKGAPLVLLHPLTGSGRVWSYQQPVFAKAGYRVIGYSRRAFQKSESGPKDRPGTGAGDLHELMNFLGIEKFHAVASAGGAFVAADYALSHPERLQSLVLACSMLSIHDGEIGKMLAGLDAPGYQELPAYFRELSPSYRAANPEGVELWKELEHNSMPGERVRQGYLNQLSLAAIRNIKTPTLLISGAADLIAPPPIAHAFARYIPNSEVVVLPECGHSGYWEQPVLFNRAVLNFIKRHRRA